MNIKVAVLDDHEFICRAISALGRDYPELAVVYTSTCPEEFQAWCLENHPDVAMVDLMLHGQLAGHETIRVLSQAGISCLAFTADHRRVPISMAMRAGARGLALKDESPDKHFETLREIHETGWSPSSAMAAALIEDAAESTTRLGGSSHQGHRPPVQSHHLLVHRQDLPGAGLREVCGCRQTGRQHDRSGHPDLGRRLVRSRRDDGTPLRTHIPALRAQ